LARLASQVGDLPKVRSFVGVPGEFDGELAPDVEMTTYTGAGRNADLIASGALDLLPVHYSMLPHLVGAGSIGADVVLIQLSPPNRRGEYSLGLTRDYVSSALARARVIIGEVHPDVPWTYGERCLTSADITAIAPAVGPLAQRPSGVITEVQGRVADNVAGLIDDGATLALGIGSLSDAVLERLTGRRHLGVHSGVITDRVADLMEAGAITGARKTVDARVTVAGMMLGTQRLFEYARSNDRIQLRSPSYTHAPDILAAQDRFVAINSAVEVDLLGQVNSEYVRERYAGTVGGSVDFLRGASRSRGGLPIVMLPSKAGVTSRIVPRLAGPVSTSRSDVGLVVTEYGIADLRGKSVRQRRQALISIAAPEFRDVLAEAEPGPGSAGVASGSDR
jgi:acetyl-CoA hydrolase